MGSAILAIIIAWLVSPIVLIILLVQEKHRHSEDVGYWMNKVDALKKENENLRNGRSANSAVSGGNGGSIFAPDLDDLHRTPSQRSRTSPPSYGVPQQAVNTPPVPAPAPVQRPAPEKLTQTAVHTAENVQAETAAAVESRPAENTGRTAAQTVTDLPAQPAAATVELAKEAVQNNVPTAEETKASVPQASDDAVSDAIKAADTFEAALEKASAQVEKFEKQAHSAAASLAEKTDSIQKTAEYTVPTASEPPVQPEPEHKAAPAAVFRDDHYGEYSMPLITPAPATKKKKVGAVNIILALGTLFVTLAGFVWAAAAWDSFPPLGKAAMLLSFSVFFFILHFVTEKKLELPSAGKVFFVLGSAFVPAAVFCAALLRIFGDGFTLDGTDAMLPLSVMFLCSSIAAFIGAVHYDSRNTAKFAYIALTGFAAPLAVWTGNTWAAVVLSVFSFAVILLGDAVKNSQLHDCIKTEYGFFSTVNIYVTALVSLFLSDGTYLYGLPAVIFSSAFLISAFRRKEKGIADVFAFCGYLAVGSYLSVRPQGIDNILLVAALVITVYTVLTLIDDVPAPIRKVVSVLHILCAGAVLIVGLIVTAAEPDFSLSVFLSSLFVTLQLILITYRTNDKSSCYAIIFAVLFAAVEGAKLLPAEYRSIPIVLSGICWILLTRTKKLRPFFYTRLSDVTVSLVSIISIIYVYARFYEAYVVLFIDWLLTLSVQYICGLIPVRAEGSSDDTDRLSFIYPFASAVVALMLYFPVKSYVGSYVLSNECMAVLFGVYTLLSVLPLIIKKIRHFSSPYALMWIPALLYAVSECTPEQKIIPAAALFIWYAVRSVRLNSAELEKNGIIYTSYPDFLTMVGMAVISLTVKKSTPMWEAVGISALFIITAYMGNFGSGRVNRNARKTAPYYTVLSVFFAFMPILSYIRRLDPANIVIDNDNTKLAVQIFAPVYLVFAVLSLLPFRYFERASLDRDAHKALRTAFHIGFGVLCAISIVFPAIGVPLCYTAYFVLSKLIPQSRGTKENADTISDDTSSILKFADAVSVVYMCIMTLNYYFNNGAVYEMALVCLFALITAALSEKSIRKYFLPAASLFVFFPLNTLTGVTHTPDIAAAVIAGYGVAAFITQRMKKQPADLTAVLPLTILFAVFIRLLDLSHGISLPLAVISLSLMANSLRYRDNSRSRMLCCTAAAVFGLSVIDHISVISAGYSSVIPCISESIPYFEDIALAAVWLIMTVLIYLHAYRHVDMSGTELRGAAVIASAVAAYIPLLCITLRYEADIFLPAAAVTAVFGLLSAAGGRIKKCPVDFIWLQPVNIIICACIQHSCNGRDASLILLISAVCLLVNSVVNTDHRWSIALCISDAAVFIGACFNYHNMDRAGSFPAKLVCITDRIPCFADVVFAAVWLIMAVVVFIHAHRYSARDRAGLRAAAVTAAVSVGYIPIIAIADRYDADMMIVASAAALLFGILPVITKKLRNSPVDLIPMIPVTVAAGIFTTMYCYPCDATLVMGVTAVSLLINAVSYRNREWSLILSLCGTVLFLNDCACYPTAVEIIKGLRESRSITDGIPFLADVVSICVWLIMTILYFLHAYRHREEKGIIRRGVSLILSAAAVFLPLYLVAQAHDMAFAVPLTIFVGIMCAFGTTNSLIPKEKRAAPEQLTRLILPALMFMTFVAMFPHKPLIACCIMLASAMVRGYQSIKQDREAGVYTLYTAVTLFMYCLAVTICAPLQNFAGSLREPVNIIITAVSAVICFIPFLITENAAGRASGRFSYISFALFSGLMFFTVADISGRWVHISDTVPIDIVPVVSTLESAFIMAVIAAYVLLVFACAVSLMKKNTVMLFPLLFWQYACMAVAMMRTGANSIFMLVPVAVFALFGRIWWNKALILPHGRKLPEKLPIYSDAFTLTAFIGALSVASFTNAGTTHKTVLWCTLTAFCILFALCRRKGNHRYVNRVVLTLSSLMIPVVVWQQPFFTIPDLFRTEIYMLPLVPALVSLYFIYREQRKIIDGFSFVTAVICLLILFFDAARTEYPADAVMLGFVIMCILALSFAFRQKRWFVLAVVSAVSEALLMTIRLWNSRTWWIYLLVVGVILLSIGISNEYEKKMAARGKKTAFSRFSKTLSEWKW